MLALLAPDSVLLLLDIKEVDLERRQLVCLVERNDAKFVELGWAGKRLKSMVDDRPRPTTLHVLEEKAGQHDNETATSD